MTAAPSAAELPRVHSGKVRELYDAGDGRLLMVASDRVSAFDVIMAEPISDKGRVLTAMTSFWSEEMADVVPGTIVAADPAAIADALGGTALPADWAAFCAYTQKTIASGTLAVSPAARQMASRLLSSAGTWLPVPGSYRALTAQLLPPVLREQFELPFGAAEARAARRLVAWARRIYPRLPARLRYVGPYHEAQQRLAGRRHPDLLARLSNRLWIGQSSLPL